MLNDLTRDDVEVVEVPYPDDDLAFHPLDSALEKGIVDAIYTQSCPCQHLQEATGKFKAIEDLSRYPDWTLQMANVPTVIMCT